MYDFKNESLLMRKKERVRNLKIPKNVLYAGFRKKANGFKVLPIF